MIFPTRAGHMPWQVKGCSGRELTQMTMRVHFWHGHVRNTVLILEEGNLPHPRCPLCDMLVPQKDLNGTHWRIEQCNWGEERRRRHLAEEEREEREVTSRDFSAYGPPLEMMNSFKYLGRVILKTENDWPAVAGNLDCDKTVWMSMSRILSRGVPTPRVSGFF